MKRKQTAQRSTTDGKHPVAAIAWLGRGSRRLWAASSCKTAPVYLCDVPLRLRAKRDLLGDSTRSQELPLCVFCVIADGGGGHSGSHGGTCPRGLRPPVKEGDSKRRTCGAAPWAPEAESLRGRDRRACFPVFAFPSSDASRGLACSGPVGAGPRGPLPAAPRGPFGPRLRPASGAQVRCSGPERLCPAPPRSGTPAGSLKLATLRKVTPRKLPKAPPSVGFPAMSWWLDAQRRPWGPTQRSRLALPVSPGPDHIWFLFLESPCLLFHRFLPAYL